MLLYNNKKEMVQEVQQQGNRYQEPNKIQGIGQTGRRVREHSQVSPTFSFECSLTCRISLVATQVNPDAPEKDGAFSMTQNGITQFRLINGILRIPLAGAYLAHIYIDGGSSNFRVTNNIKVGNKIIYTVNTQNTQAETDMILNLGRYDMLKFTASGHYSGSSGSASTYTDLTMTLKKL